MKVGEVEIEFLGHSGFLVRVKNKTIIIDPYRVSENVPKADLILITHSHNDHCSIRDIQKVSRKGTVVLCPVDCQSTLMKVKGVDVNIVEKEDILDFRSFRIECVVAYTANKHHSQNEGWLGYLIKFERDIIYFASDTDLTIELKSLSGYGKKENNFITILPVSGTVAMSAIEAANSAVLLKSTLAIPHGYGSGIYGTIEDAKRFVELCQQRGVKAEILDKI